MSQDTQDLLAVLGILTVAYIANAALLWAVR